MLLVTNTTRWTEQNNLSCISKRVKLLEANTKDLMKSFSQKKIKVGDNIDKDTLEGANGVPFWRLMKELTLLGYYTSEKGVEASFIYEQTPGKYELITDMKPTQKSFMY